MITQEELTKRWIKRTSRKPIHGDYMYLFDIAEIVIMLDGRWKFIHTNEPEPLITFDDVPEEA